MQLATAPAAAAAAKTKRFMCTEEAKVGGLHVNYFRSGGFFIPGNLIIAARRIGKWRVEKIVLASAWLSFPY